MHGAAGGSTGTARMQRVEDALSRSRTDGAVGGAYRLLDANPQLAGQRGPELVTRVDSSAPSTLGAAVAPCVIDFTEALCGASS